MRQFDVTGMSCAACSARVEKAVSKLDGVESCSVNLLTNSMSVEGDISDEIIIAAVQQAGYDANLKGETQQKEALNIKGSKTVSKLIYSLVLLIILMYFSMGAMMFKLPLPRYFEHNPLANGLIQMILSFWIILINNKFVVSGFKSIKNKSPNMDALVSLGSGASFIYSTYALFRMSEAYVSSDFILAHTYLHELYFESAAMILVLISVGNYLKNIQKVKQLMP